MDLHKRSMELESWEWGLGDMAYESIPYLMYGCICMIACMHMIAW